MKIDLLLTPVPVKDINQEGKSIAIVDVLRSGTSICQALLAGAKAVIPADGRSEAVEIKQKLETDNCILAGESEGVKIENFALGNSPFEFKAENVFDKFVILATSNGTPIFKRSKHAALVVAAALVNSSVTADLLAKSDNDLIIICSGKEGQFSIEDTLCGGLLVDLLINKHNVDAILNDAAQLALLLYRNSQNTLEKTILESEHGRYLEAIGYVDDVHFSSKLDSLEVIPVLKDGKLIKYSV